MVIDPAAVHGMGNSDPGNFLTENVAESPPRHRIDGESPPGVGLTWRVAEISMENRLLGWG